MVVLSVDAGIQVCGVCVCEIASLKIKLLKEKEIKPHAKWALAKKLGYIFEELEREIRIYKPSSIIVEKLYSHYRHPTTLGVLSQIKGIISLLTYQFNIDFFEYSSTRARKSFIGRGNVNSLQIKKMAENITKKNFLSEHTADAFSLVSAFTAAEKMARLRAN